MLRRFSTNAAITTMLLDTLLVIAALELTNELNENRQNFHILTYFVFPIIWWAVFLIGAIYDGNRNMRIIDELSSYFSMSLIIVLVLAGIIYLSSAQINHSQFATFVGLSIGLQLLARLLLRLYWRLTKKNGNGTHRILIVGAGELGRHLQEKLTKHPEDTGNYLVGFVDDAPSKRNLPNLLGQVQDTPTIIVQERISDVIVTLPANAHKLREELTVRLQTLPVRIWVIPEIFRMALLQPNIETFAGISMLAVRAPAINEQQRIAKRIFDLVIGSLMLATLWPLMLLISALIRRDSPGPAIFRQTRIGENGLPFEMYKFRTMVENAESLRHVVETEDENGNLLHKSPTDPRITRIGHFLRRTSVDELPQLFNVLRGNMSLVGPRPELPYIVEKYQPWQHARHSVPPGITGWWQVNGRSDKPMHLHTEDDIYYVKNCSIWLDIQILLKTTLVVFLKKGAY